MNYTNLSHSFCIMVNEGLVQNKDVSDTVLNELKRNTREKKESLLLSNMYQNFHEAIKPSSFFNVVIRVPDEHFKQGYELLKHIFKEDERDSRARYLKMLELAFDKSYFAPLVLLGRFWQVSGPQIYEPAGQLRQFHYDQLAVSENIVGIISGNYMALQSSQSGKLDMGFGIGALGNLGIREHFRKGQGHGTALINMFDQEIEAIADRRGEKLCLMILEAQKDSIGFWLKKGYRYVEGVQYAQPPLDFDPLTGERYYDEVPEILMIKLPGEPDAEYVDTQLLADSVYTMYQNWCLGKVSSYTPIAQKRATDYVIGKVFAQFLVSLSKKGSRVRLTDTSD